MTTFTDPYSTFNWQDGMEVNVDVLNNGQRFVRAMHFDQVLQSTLGALSNTATRPEFGGDDGGDASTLWAYCVSPGRAFLRQGSANNKIQIAPGTLLQKIATSDGNDATLVPFTFAGTEEFTLTNGDATNPRVDLLQMKLEYVTDTTLALDLQDAVTRALTTPTFSNTRRRVRCTLTVKAGTPAASPVIPDPDAGFVPVGTVVVGHNWVTGGTAPIFGVDTADTANAIVHDQRMPLTMKSYVVDPVIYKLETAWALGQVNTLVTSSNSTNLLFARCPTTIGRLLMVDLKLQPLTPGAASFGIDVATVGSPPSAQFVSQNGFGTNTINFNTIARSRRIDFESLHLPTAGPTVLPSITNNIGVPLWTSGFRTPVLPAVTKFLNLRIQNQANSSTLGEIVFYVAS